MQKKERFFRAILTTALIAGLFDIIAAMINYMISTGGKNPVAIFKYIASAVFGKEIAHSQGLPMIVLGLLFHFAIAFIFTAFFFFIYPNLRLLQKNIFITCMVYGLFVWVIMNLVVLPLSNVSAFSFRFNIRSIIGILILMFVFSPPIAFRAKRYFQIIRPK